MHPRAILKALVAGGLTTLATAALTVHAAGAPHVPLQAVNVLHLAPVPRQAIALTALHPGQSVLVVNDSHRALQLKGIARNG